MALLQPFAIKTQLGNTDLELTAGPGESFLIKDIITHYCAESYCTIRIDKTTVGYFRQGGSCGAHIFRKAAWNRHSHGITLNIDQGLDEDDIYKVRNVVGENTALGMGAKIGNSVSGNYRFNEAVQQMTGHRTETLLEYLSKRGDFKGFPVAEGETFKITGAARTYCKQIVVYEIHEAGDMASNMENGSKADSYLFLNYGNCGATINVNGDSLFTTSISPAEFPSFPFGAVVPAKNQIELLGICATPFAPKENDDTNYIYTQFMKFVKDREVLFDEDRQGIIFENRQLSLTHRTDSYAQGISLIGNKSEYDLNDPFMFTPPLIFAPGDELGIYLTTVKVLTGQNITVDEHEICLIQRVTRLE
ncbi:hypothetical protein ES702_05651 [subsurface metagenome]